MRPSRTRATSAGERAERIGVEHLGRGSSGTSQPLVDEIVEVLAERLILKMENRLVSLLPGATQPEVLIRARDAARIIGVPESWLEAQARCGGFRSYKRGRYRRYDPREVVEDFKALDSR